MKNLKITIVAILALSFFSFTLLKEKQINLETSTIIWTGKKVTGSHEGTIKLKSGVLKFEDDKLISGNFEVDMTSIDVTDLSGGSKEKLEGHLKSDDFFGVENHDTATFKTTNVSLLSNNVYEVSGDLTIKGIKQEANLTMTVNESSATTKLTIDRTKFDIKYGSGKFFDNLKDKAISDDFELDILLNF